MLALIYKPDSVFVFLYFSLYRSEITLVAMAARITQ